jgi:hypothetical protein
MSDWDFLHDMHHAGYSAADISDAAAIGYAPWQTPNFGDEPLKHKPVKKSEPHVPQAQSENQTAKAVQAMEMLRQAGILTRPQFLACKAAILK